LLKRLRRLKRSRLWKKNAFFRATLLIVISTVIVAWLIFVAEKGSNKNFNSFWDGVWWFFVTISTVGYGDKVPGTPVGKIIAVFMMLFGVAILSVVTATISSIFVAQKLKEGKGLQEIKFKDHLLLCGWNGKCDEILSILEKQPKEFPGIVLINQLPEETIVELLARYESLNLRFVRGDFTKENVLIRAGGKSARIAVIVPDESAPLAKKGDERTILTTLSLKTLNPKIRVIVHILDRENYTHLSKAKADEIVVSDAYTSHLLANYVIAPGVPLFLDRVFSDDPDVQLNQRSVPEELIGKTYDDLKAYCQNRNPRDILLGLGEIKEPFDLSTLMSADYSYLDEFIMRKFQEAGLGKKEENRIRIQLAPEGNTKLNSSHFYLILERAADEKAKG